MNSHLQPRLTPASASTPEGELVSRATAGDGAAFGVLMRRHNQLLYRTARSILKSDAESEDAVQEAFLRAWRALGSYRAKSRLATWLVRIVTNEALGRLRRTTPHIIPLEAAMLSVDPATQAALTDSPDRGPEQSLLRAQDREVIEMHIDLLPDIYRTVFVLRAVEEMSVEDVAHSLDIPQGTVRTRFFRARRLLRESLASEVRMPLSEVFAFDGARCDRIVANVLSRGCAEGLANPGTA